MLQYPHPIPQFFMFRAKFYAQQDADRFFVRHPIFTSDCNATICSRGRNTQLPTDLQKLLSVLLCAK